MLIRASVHLWGREIGAVVWNDARQIGVFEYTPEFIRSGIQLAPITMPLRAGPFDFPGLGFEAFKGLPGLLSDSLPDKFGNLLIDAWLARQGRPAGSMNPVERLCYTGTRGMGALEFQPDVHPGAQKGHHAQNSIDVAQMVSLANDILTERAALNGALGADHDAEQLGDILRIGTSAGGARAKAVIAWNEESGEFRSGQVEAGQGFGHWLLKFDGISGNRDKELADPQGFGRLEYACYLVAKSAGVTMSRCRLHEEGARAHFMTERFDRRVGGEKLHMLSLGGLCHYDFNQPRAYGYEQAILALRQIGAPRVDLVEQTRRAYLNVMLRNQDDHVKNIAFLMDKSGAWRLSPAFDVCYAYNPQGDWTSQHQMSLNGKINGFSRADLLEFGRFADLKPREARDIYDEVHAAVSEWAVHCETAGVDPRLADGAKAGLRLDLPKD